jgi:plasmid maintenance system antidote protein VapI
MTPSCEHPRLVILLLAAATKLGSQAALASALDIDESRLSGLINGKRFVTMSEAIKIEVVLGVPARQLLIEAHTAKIDVMLATAHRH